MRLLEAIAIQMNCKNILELKNLSQDCRTRLAVLLEERVPAGLADIEEWNEVLGFFFGTKSINSEKAKQELLLLLKDAQAVFKK